MNDIDAELLEDIVEANKCLHIILGVINIKCIGTSDQVKIQPSNARDLIGKKSIEVMLNMGKRIKAAGIAIKVKWQ